MKARAGSMARLAAVAASAALTAGAAAAASAPTVLAAHSDALGTILVSASGRTLYHDSAEKAGAIACTGSCAAVWPPLLLAKGAKPVAGAGVKASLLGTVKRPGGTVQVTYHGMPLYLYSGDTGAGQAKGQDVGGIWHAVAPSGSIVTIGAATTSAQTSSGKSSLSGSSSVSSSGSSAVAASGSGSSSGSAGTSAPTTTSTTSSGDQADGCPPGQSIPQGPNAGDADEDNGVDGPGFPDDGDGCL